MTTWIIFIIYQDNVLAKNVPVVCVNVILRISKLNILLDLRPHIPMTIIAKKELVKYH